MIQHIVLFSPKDDLEESARRSFAQIVVDVLGKASYISDFTIGKRVVIDAGYQRIFGDKTYEYAAVLSFADASSLVAYLRSPEHAELGRLFWEMCQGAAIVEAEVVAGRENADPRRLI